jgi:hypothetical protein
MAKKSLAEIFVYPKTLRVCRPYDSHLVLDLELRCELAARVAFQIHRRRRDGIAWSDGDGRPAMA